MISLKTIGEKILTLRKAQNLNQKQLADMAHITEATLSRYEHNQRKPRGQIVSRLAKILNVSTDYLLDSQNNNLEAKKEIFRLEEEARFLDALDSEENLIFCGVEADRADREYLKDAFNKFMLDAKIYANKKYCLKDNEKE